jgi:hypothetical protein
VGSLVVSGAPRRAMIAPNKFKETLDAAPVSVTIARVVARCWPNAVMLLHTVPDPGERTWMLAGVCSSCSTDVGPGAIAALGGRIYDSGGRQVRPRGGAITRGRTRNLMPPIRAYVPSKSSSLATSTQSSLETTAPRQLSVRRRARIPPPGEHWTMHSRRGRLSPPSLTSQTTRARLNSLPLSPLSI